MSIPTNLKVVVLGESGVGKSSVVLRFITNVFNPTSEATLGASFVGKALSFNDKILKFNIWDTAGQEKYHSLAKMYYRDADAAIMVYDITKRDSFNGLKKWYEELKENGPRDIVVAIAGNKEDLVENEAVSPQDAKAYADSIGAIFRKTSAKTCTGIDQIFKDIALKIFPELKEEARSRRSTVSLRPRNNSNENKKKKKCC
ncbi:unnamed protein product [Blepharisma stoltei]|uniref:Uncharacterized protein n=1 Tax=Blepharisma stoltei TaxID=1481888 RepID=A0AAU9KA62_9CILI|nr:unnamed protein product [Blepharisma stoltei]